MQRYFADIINNKVVLSKEDEHHISHVMRNKVGDEIEVVFDEKLYLCKISSFSPSLEIEVESQIDTDLGSSKNVTLFFALAKGDKNELVIQKATELGVKNIVLIETKRCVAKFDDDKKANHKFERFNKIIKEAAEQSKRLSLPKIHGVFKLKDLPKDLICYHNFVAYEKEQGSTTSFVEDLMNLDKNVSVGIAIGPEGGFEKEEVEYLKSIGFKSVSLGNRILRTETAAMFAVGAISFILER